MSSDTLHMAEAGDKPEAPPPTAVSFFDPSLSAVRRGVFIQWGRTVLILCTFILAILSLFWAVQSRVNQNMPALKIWVVDFDAQLEPYRNTTPIVGPAVVEVVNQTLSSGTPNLGYTIRTPADFNNDPWAVRQSVYDEHAYGAIIINANATALLRDAVTTGNSSYDPLGAAEFIIISARDDTSYYNYIIPFLSEFDLAVRSYFGPLWVQTVASEGLNFTAVPQAINPAIGFTTIDLRPFGPPVITPAVSIGLIYLIILAFFNTPFMMPIHVQLIKGNHPPLKIPQWLLWRILSNIATYFFLSLFYSFVSLAFQIPFDNPSAPDTQPADNPNAYGHASFFVFWMLNWVGMSALGFPCENMAMILGFPWSALFLIFWVITNVATGFYALDLAPGFFAWGYAWPLHRIVEALRTILFDKHSRIGLDFGILFAWIAFSIALFPLAAAFMRWKMKHGWA
ncbi:MNNG and nitrosoguanidine resistance protein [Aspergillus heteromorphus CBS 117.55]|uniref:MNNG and nitrosoguanidine resistance protein n=1 Tax=Aspergillus heteromorphus CBS 117.55 TaxID=1448321 RepID=A0A317VRH7_9EURO|nr:MNNG and nitrosoguanidine resistance protein [Aspergillus heteromorphus CBS 117.55]PWY75492.1 MNNG and nitrosoguanidine resistance protein [Aspergillus heteromorphus CBS 117.55]